MSDLAGVALVIGAVGVFVTTIVNAIVTLRTHRVVKHVDAAVNGVPEGERTLKTEVHEIHDKVVNGDAG